MIKNTKYEGSVSHFSFRAGNFLKTIGNHFVEKKKLHNRSKIQLGVFKNDWTAAKTANKLTYFLVKNESS